MLTSDDKIMRTLIATTLVKQASQDFVKFVAIFSRGFFLLISLTVIGVSAQAADSELANGPEDELKAVGEVSLVLGRAFLISADQPRKPVQAGSQIQASDKILTESNGHVHIRFIDNALVSVRPNSQLEILSYQYNSDNPESSSFKFNLVEGVTRAVSGAGAKAARSRFRLNTPIAAIGVRGTDFVVSATEQTTRALVNQGAIVLAPYSDACSEATLGPCSVNAVELTENSMQMAELDSSGIIPRLIPATSERDSQAFSREIQLAAIDSGVEAADDTTIGAEVYLDNVAITRAEERVEATIPDFTPELVVASDDLSSKQLVWGRWADQQSELERITVSFDEARQGRRVTVGNDDYILYRVEGARPQVERGLGLVSFSLNSAQAFYNAESGVVAMQVNGGELDIDFEQSLFATELNLSSADTGFIDFIAAGAISDRGYFYDISSSQRMAGAVSQDGLEAGYFFEKQLESGSIQGLTLWDSQ